MSYSNDNKPKISDTRKTIALLAVLLLFSGLVHATVLTFYYEFNIKPEYKKEVHGHILNAYYSNTPDLMLSELRMARSGMVSLGLEEDMYGTMFPWKQTPDNKMNYQYDILDSVIERVEAVKADRERQEQQGSSDQFKDVYEEKMDNLRGFLKEEGWIDDIAKEVFIINNHPYYAWWQYWGAFTTPLWVGLVFIPFICHWPRIKYKLNQF